MAFDRPLLHGTGSTVDGGSTTLITFPNPADSAEAWRALIVGRRTSGGDNGECCCAYLMVRARNHASAGTPRSVTSSHYPPGPIYWAQLADVTMQAVDNDATTGVLTVTGCAATPGNMSWAAGMVRGGQGPSRRMRFGTATTTDAATWVDVPLDGAVDVPLATGKAAAVHAITSIRRPSDGAVASTETLTLIRNSSGTCQVLSPDHYTFLTYSGLGGFGFPPELRAQPGGAAGTWKLQVQGVAAETLNYYVRIAQVIEV